MSRPSALLFAPSLRKEGVLLSGTHTSELLYLGQYLFDNGFDVGLVDAYADPREEARMLGRQQPDYIVVDLWKNESLLGDELHRLLSFIRDAKNVWAGTRSVFIGSISASIVRELLGDGTVVDAVVTQHDAATRPDDRTVDSIRDLDIIRRYFEPRSAPRLTEEFLKSAELVLRPGDIVSLYSSKGCRKACSFCSYNRHIERRTVRPIEDLVSDIALVVRSFGVTRFALADNNFGDDPRETLARVNEFLKCRKPYAIDGIQLSLNMSCDGLTEAVLDGFKAMGVNSILLGLESFDPKTLSHIFHKRLDLGHFRRMVNYAERIGITPVVSYILFHPWLTYEQLRSQVDEIAEFGRYRLVHFLAKSLLQVVPGTSIEQRLTSEGLLTGGGMNRSFVFKDERVANVYTSLRGFFDAHYPDFNQSTTELARLKIAEWHFLTELLDDARPALQRGSSRQGE